MKRRTIIVQVLDTPIPVGNEFAATSYPHDGVFQLMDGRFFVRHGTYAMQLALPAGFNPFSAAMFTEPEPEVQFAPVSQSIDAITLLKAIAISKQPELAVELCK